ncbi:MAG: AraC family transcriptional regulator [Myxococcota bacterium]
MASSGGNGTWTPVLDDETGIVWVDAETAGGGVRLLLDRHAVMWTVSTPPSGQQVFHFGALREVRPDALMLFEPGDLFDGRHLGRQGRFRLVFVPDGCVAEWFGEAPWRPPQGRVAELTSPRAVEAMRTLVPPGTTGDWSGLARVVLDRVVEEARKAPASRHGAVSVAVRRARAIVGARWAEPPTLDELADEVGVSKYHLLRSFRSAYGATPAAYGRLLKVAVARAILAEGGSVTDAVDEGRFADQAHLTRVFRDVYLSTPRRYADSPTK